MSVWKGGFKDNTSEYPIFRQIHPPSSLQLEMLLIPKSRKCNCACALPAEVQLRLCVTLRSWQKWFAGKNFVKILVTAQTQLRSYSEQQRAFGYSNISNWPHTQSPLFTDVMVIGECFDFYLNFLRFCYQKQPHTFLTFHVEIYCWNVFCLVDIGKNLTNCSLIIIYD